MQIHKFSVNKASLDNALIRKYTSANNYSWHGKDNAPIRHVRIGDTQTLAFSFPFGVLTQGVSRAATRREVECRWVLLSLRGKVLWARYAGSAVRWSAHLGGLPGRVCIHRDTRTVFVGCISLASSFPVAVRPPLTLNTGRRYGGR